MKKTVKLICLVLCAYFVFLISGCYAAYEKAYLNITNVNGGGVRRIDCFFIADGFVHPDSPAGGTHNNDTYFPEGVEAAVNWLQNKVDGDIFTLSLNDTEDGFHVVSVEFSFADVNEYNERIALLNSYGGSYSGELSPAKLSVKEQGENYVAVWQEESGTAHSVTAWMYEALINEGAEDGIFSKDNVNYKENATRAEGNAQDTIVLSGDTVYCVTLGDVTSIFNTQEDVFVTGQFVNDESFAGEFCEELPKAKEAKPTQNTQNLNENASNGKTVLWVVIISLSLIILLAVFVFLFVRVRKSKLK